MSSQNHSLWNTIFTWTFWCPSQAVFLPAGWRASLLASTPSLVWDQPNMTLLEFPSMEAADTSLPAIPSLCQASLFRRHRWERVKYADAVSVFVSTTLLYSQTQQTSPLSSLQHGPHFLLPIRLLLFEFAVTELTWSSLLRTPWK